MQKPGFLLSCADTRQLTLEECWTMERPAKRAKTSVEDREAEEAPQPDGLGDVQVPIDLQEAEPIITFYTLPYELRSEIYYLAGIPTKIIFELKGKPIFCGPSQLSGFCDIFGSYPDSDDCYPDQRIDQQPVQANDSHSGQAEGTRQTGEDRQAAMDDDARPPRDDVDAVEDIYDDPDRSETIRGLLLASKQVRDEVLDILYGQNIFRVDLFEAGKHPGAITEVVNEGKAGRIRHLMMVLLDPPTGGQLCNSVELGPNPAQHYKLELGDIVWDSMIPKLKSLRIVVAPPCLPIWVERHEHLPFCQYLMAIDQWDYSLEQFFRYVSGNLLPETALLTDIRSWLAEHSFPAYDAMIKTHVNHGVIKTTMGYYLGLAASGLCPEHLSFCEEPVFDDNTCEWCEAEALQGCYQVLLGDVDTPQSESEAEFSNESESNHDSDVPLSDSAEDLEMDAISEPDNSFTSESKEESD